MEENLPPPLQTPAVRVKKLSIKRVTKKAKTKPDLNSSSVKLKASATPSFKSFSFLNASLQKKTLRQNNCALAQGLAKARQTLRDANSENAELRTKNHELTVELLRLKRVTELKDYEIDNEVQLRMRDHMLQMKADLEELTQNMLASSSVVSNLHDKCITFCRGSIASSRASSFELSISDDVTTQLPVRQKRGAGVERNPRPLSFTLPRSRSAVDDFPPVSASDLDPEGDSSNHDLSMITEQSFMGKEPTEMLHVPHLDAVSESECLVLTGETLDKAETLTSSGENRSEIKEKDNCVDAYAEFHDLSTLSAGLDGIMDELVSGSPMSVPESVNPLPSAETEKERVARRETIVLDMPVVLVTDDKQELGKEKTKTTKELDKDKRKEELDKGKKKELEKDRNKKELEKDKNKKGLEKDKNKKELEKDKNTKKDIVNPKDMSKPRSKSDKKPDKTATSVSTVKVNKSLLNNKKKLPVPISTSKSSTSLKSSESKSKDSVTYSVDRSKDSTHAEPTNEIVNETFNPFKPNRTLHRSPPSKNNSPQQAAVDEPEKRIDSSKFLDRLRANTQTSDTTTVEARKTINSDKSSNVTDTAKSDTNKNTVLSSKAENKSSKNKDLVKEDTIAVSSMDKPQQKPQDLHSGECIYELPMPKGSPEDKPVKTRRGRSKSGTRSKSVTRSKSKTRKSLESDERDDSPPRSRSKSVTRGRSRSRRVVESGDEEVHVHVTDTRSRSRVRKNIDVKATEEKESEMKSKEIDPDDQPSLRRSARSRSRVRTIASSDSEKSSITESAETDKNILTEPVNMPQSVPVINRQDIEQNAVAQKETSDIDISSRSVANKTSSSHIFAKPFDANPFKPSKNLLRSPPFKNNMSEPKENEGPADKIDGRMFLDRLRSGDDLQPIEYSFADEPTQYFDSNMELTCALDTIPMSKNNRLSPALPIIESESPISSNSSNIEKEKKSKVKKSAVPDNKEKKNNVDNLKVKEKPDQHKEIEKIKKAAPVDKENDINDGAAVEMRTKKPGNFTFAISRKESDGTRKPVPDKISRARSKKKKIITPEKDVNRSEEDKDVFNFGDRTPTMPLDKIQKVAAVYDLSMNESVQIPPIRLNNFRDKLNGMEENVVVNSIKVKDKKQELRPGECIYEMPMPKGSPEVQPKKSKRGRSKSGTRSKSRKSDDSDDEYVPHKASRSRSRSRKVNESSDSEQTHTRTRSRSQVRKNTEETESTSNDNVDLKKSRLQSQVRKTNEETEKNSSDNVAICKRSKSRSRRKVSSPDDESSPPPPVKKPSRSKSRSREVSSSDEETSPTPVRKPLRSRARPIVLSDTEDSFSIVDAEPMKIPVVIVSNIDTIRSRSVERQSNKNLKSCEETAKHISDADKTTTDNAHINHLPLKDRPETSKENKVRKSRSKCQLPPKDTGSESDVDSIPHVNEFKFVTNSRSRSRGVTLTKSIDNVCETKNSEKDIDLEESSANDVHPQVESPDSPKSVRSSKSVKKKPPSSKKVQASTKSTKKRKPLIDVAMETPTHSNIEKQKSTKKHKLVEKLDKAEDLAHKTSVKVKRLSTKTPATGKASSKSGTTAKSSKVKTEKSARKRKVDPVPLVDETPKKIEINFVDRPGANKENQNSSLANIRRRLNALNQRTSSEVSHDEPACSTKRDVDEFTNDADADKIFESDNDQPSKRVRRTKAAVSYVTVPLNKKLRQGDQMFKANQANSPISRAKAEKVRLMLGHRTSIFGVAAVKEHE